MRSQEKDFENVPPGATKAANSFAPLDSMSVEKGERKNLVTLRTEERSGNVYENKGPLWKNKERSGNVVDNT